MHLGDNRVLEVPVEDAKHCCEVNHAEHDQFVEQTDRWDKLGITLSTICAIHCVITPFLALAVPVLGETFEQPWVHLVMAVFVVPTGLYAFFSGYQHHKQKGLVALGVLGIILIAIGLLAPISGLNLFGHDVITIIGSAALIVAHVLNRRACHCDRH
ncbi:MerC domain-containing protein [Bdellovibrio sp. NC01]|nr:MerC domain-containing protein [Bdellovibrio sp. NC01]